jgi:hypothetical protein
MSQINTQSTPSTEPTEKGAAPREAETVVDTLFDLAEAWAVYGLNLGKSALEGTAKALARTAEALDKLAARLEKKPA